MPGTMIHFLPVHLLYQNPPPDLLVGAIAPDALRQRATATNDDRAQVHFRNPSRWHDLLAYARTVATAYEEGCLLHEYTDACWEETLLPGFLHYGEAAFLPREYTYNDWLRPYYRDMMAASMALYRQPWSEAIWAGLAAGACRPFLPPQGPTAEEVAAFRDHITERHRTQAPEEAVYFTAERIQAFASYVAQTYPRWRMQTSQVTLQPIGTEDETLQQACIQMDVYPHQESFIATNAFSLAQAEEEPQLRPYAIFHNQTPVGFTLTAPDPGPEGHRYWIARFMIDKASQGLGLGKRALDLLIDMLRGQGHPDIWLSYEPDNHAARKLYRSRGFHETGEIEDGEVVAIRRGIV